MLGQPKRAGGEPIAPDRFDPAADAFLAQCRPRARARGTAFPASRAGRRRRSPDPEPDRAPPRRAGRLRLSSAEQDGSLGGGIGRHRREQLGIGARFARAGRHDERDVQLFEARQQEGQVAQRRSVRPVRIVDDHAERARRSEIRAQPVEAVQDRERGIDARGGLTIRGGAPGSPSRPAATPAAACSRSARSSSDASASGGSNSWRTTPKAKSRSSSVARDRSTRIPSLPPPSAPPRAAPSCRSRPALRPRRTCRAPCERRRAPTRSAPAPRSARAAPRWTRPLSCAASLLPLSVSESPGGLHGANHRPGLRGSGRPIPSSITSS